MSSSSSCHLAREQEPAWQAYGFGEPQGSPHSWETGREGPHQTTVNKRPVFKNDTCLQGSLLWFLH